MKLCYDCQRPTDSLVTDGENYVCKECARLRSDELYERFSKILAVTDELTRKSFAVYGNDDFWNLVNEEIDNG